MKKFIVLIMVYVIATATVFSQSRKLKMGNNAPEFSALNVNDSVVNLLDFRGKKVLINFYRSVGCPVCNLYFHEIQEYADTLKIKNVVVISVYESRAASIRKYLEGESFYSIMIPDSSEQLYNLYSVQRSWWKMFKSNFTGTYGKKGKIRRGYALYKRRLKYDAHLNRIGADFLIDEKGKIVFAYYGKFFGDHISLEQIKTGI